MAISLHHLRSMVYSPQQRLWDSHSKFGRSLRICRMPDWPLLNKILHVTALPQAEIYWDIHQKQVTSFVNEVRGKQLMLQMLIILTTWKAVGPYMDVKIYERERHYYRTWISAVQWQVLLKLYNNRRDAGHTEKKK